MKPQPITTYNPSFGIYKGYKPTKYGGHLWGEYKGYNIDIYTDNRDKVKLQYVSDSNRRWLRSKLIYYFNGIKRIIKSNNKER